MRANEFGCGGVASFWDDIFLEVERCFGDDGFDGGVEDYCDFLDDGEGCIPVEVVLDGLF